MRKETLILSLLFLGTLCGLSPADTPLEACGFHTLTIDMEQLPDQDDYYYINNDCMFIYNQYMDIFRYYASDNSWGQNYENEFGGWPSDEDLYSLWEYHWDDSLGMTVWVWEGTCEEIYESDVIFNPSYSWTTDPDFAEGNTDVVLYTPVVYHEAAHAWGLQTRNETYDYDVPTVVHAYKYDIVHDVHVIHTPDARVLRLHYKDQIGIPAIRNVGVFSKYADGTWKNAYTDKTNYTAGDLLSAYGVMVENTGNKDANDVRLLFYLSTDKVVSSSDILIEEWQWDGIADQRWTVFDFLDMPIPEDIDPGEYYLVALITINHSNQVDELFDDDVTHLFEPITIEAATPTFTPTATPTEVPTPTATPQTGEAGDLTGDGSVDQADALQLLKSWESGAEGDITGDGSTDYRDIFLFAANWHR